MTAPHTLAIDIGGSGISALFINGQLLPNQEIDQGLLGGIKLWQDEINGKFGE